MTEIQTEDIVIIGGGITGLAAAHYLQQQQPNATITLIEAADYLGGKIATDYVDGFILEAAPDCFLSRKPRGIGLAKEMGVEAELQGRKPAKERAYVMRHGRLHTLPEGLSGMIPTQLEPLLNHSLLSEEGAKRVADEPNLPVKTDDSEETVGAFVSRRLGREAFENIVEPLMGGIYAGQANQLSIMATFPQLRQLELKHGSLLKGLANASPPADSPYPPFVSFKNGMAELIKHITARFNQNVTIHLNTKASQIEQSPDGYWLTTIEDSKSAIQNLKSKILILATPAFINAQLLSAVAPDAAAAHADIPYVSTALVNFAFNTADLPTLPEGYGYVTPQVEKREALACTWTSKKWDNRAPEGKTLLRVYIGRYGENDVTQYDDARLIGIAKREIAETCQITAEPFMTRIYRWPSGLPQYNLGHLERLARIDAEISELPGLFVAGAAYNGVGIPDCIKSGESAAKEALLLLKQAS